MMARGFRRWIVLTLVLAACSAPAAIPAASDPTASAPSQPVAAGFMETPTYPVLSNPTPAAILEEPEPTATHTPAPAPANLPLERIALYSPGPGSQVTSPIEISGRSGPSFNERVHLRLLGEDGRVLAQRTAYLDALRGFAGPFLTQLAFDLPEVAEAGRLEVSIDDRRTGRMSHLTTLDLVLLTAGAARIHPATQGPEQLTLLAPRDGAGVRGSGFSVRGAGWTVRGLPLVLALLDNRGDVLSSQAVSLMPSGIGEVGVFEAEVTYQTPYEQYGRLALYELAEDGASYLHYTSIELYLRR